MKYADSFGISRSLPKDEDGELKCTKTELENSCAQHFTYELATPMEQDILLTFLTKATSDGSASTDAAATNITRTPKEKEKETEERDSEEEHRWVTIQTIRNITVKVEKNIFNSSICTRGYYSIAGGYSPFESDFCGIESTI